MNGLPLSPFITDPEHRFVLDEAAFMEALDVPAFIASPSPEFVAAEIEPLLEILFRRRAA